MLVAGALVAGSLVSSLVGSLVGLLVGSLVGPDVGEDEGAAVESRPGLGSGRSCSGLAARRT